MSTSMFVLALAAAYLIGSIPFGLAVARLVAGVDIRKVGSGNIGATNVGRIVGAKWGACVLLLDAMKGLVPTLVLPRLIVPVDEPAFVHLEVGCGVMAILGHMFPVWLGFRGGKGVATALGVVAVLGGWSTLIACAAFGLSFAIWRIVSLSSLISAITFAVSQIVLLRSELISQWSLTLFSITVPALIIYRHRGNVMRLLRGEERAFRPAERTDAAVDADLPADDE